MIQTIVDTTLAPLADRLGAHPRARGQEARGFLRTGDRGADSRGRSGLRVNRPQGLFLACWRGQKALEPVTVV
jgi:hypothetical protein